MKKIISLLTVLCLVLCLLPASVSAEETTEIPTVTVYFSMSHDEDFRDGAETGEVMALREITVPYFDIGLYDLQEFYFVSESYSDDGDGLPGSDLEAGTKEFAEGKITMLHLFIYATEVYYCGIEPEAAGKGYLADEGLLGSSTMAISGSRGSIFFEEFWGRDLNFNYYHNYHYPLASAGWGSTADQILLHDGDVVTMGHFSDWNFFKDPDSIFNYIKAGEDTVRTTAVKGEEVELTIWRAGASEDGDYTTEHEIVTSNPKVYCTSVNELDTDVSNWQLIGTADSEGKITVDTSDLEPGQYMIAIPGQYGSSDDMKDVICSTPGGILLDVVEQGDISGNAEVDAKDASMLYGILNNRYSASDAQLMAGDMNKDGEITARDAAMLYAYINGKLK